MKILLLIITCITISACTTIKQNNGAEVRPLKLEQVSAASTKGDVFNLLGSPSTKSVYGDETWYYITSKIEKQLVRDDQILKQNVIAITFNELDEVQNVELYGTDDGRQFATSDRVTPTAGRSLNMIEQLLGNVGKFNTESTTGQIGSRSPSGGRGTP